MQSGPNDIKCQRFNSLINSVDIQLHIGKNVTERWRIRAILSYPVLCGKRRIAIGSKICSKKIRRSCLA